jgi:ATP-dependent Lon protease
VRNLNREIGSVMRYVAKKVAMEEAYEVTVKPEHLHDILGPTKFDAEVYQEQQAPGVAIGLAWTSVGGEILFIEVSLNKGNGRLQLTGNLGDVMKESASTALSYIKAHADEFGIDPEMPSTKPTSTSTFRKAPSPKTAPRPALPCFLPLPRHSPNAR